MLQPRKICDQVPWMPAYNTTNGTIPPFAILQIVSVNADGSIQVGQPTTSGATNYFFNGPLPIPPNSYGICCRHFPALAAFSSGTPVVGQTWGAAAGSWYLSSSQTGYTIVGDPQTGRVAIDVAPASGGGGGGGGANYSTTNLGTGDSAAIITSATTLQIDEGSGLTLTPAGTSSGIAATLAAQLASSTHAGMVSKGPTYQLFAGDKGFNNNVCIGNFLNMGPNYTGSFADVMNEQGVTFGSSPFNVSDWAFTIHMGATNGVGAPLVFQIESQHNVVAAGNGFSFGVYRSSTLSVGVDRTVTIAGTTLTILGGVIVGVSP